MSGRVETEVGGVHFGDHDVRSTKTAHRRESGQGWRACAKRAKLLGGILEPTVAVRDWSVRAEIR